MWAWYIFGLGMFDTRYFLSLQRGTEPLDNDISPLRFWNGSMFSETDVMIELYPRVMFDPKSHERWSCKDDKDMTHWLSCLSESGGRQRSIVLTRYFFSFCRRTFPRIFLQTLPYKVVKHLGVFEKPSSTIKRQPEFMRRVAMSSLLPLIQQPRTRKINECLESDMSCVSRRRSAKSHLNASRSMTLTVYARPCSGWKVAWCTADDASKPMGGPRL